MPALNLSSTSAPPSTLYIPTVPPPDIVFIPSSPFLPTAPGPLIPVLFDPTAPSTFPPIFPPTVNLTRYLPSTTDGYNAGAKSSPGMTASTNATLVSITYDAPGTYLTALPSEHVHFLSSPVTDPSGTAPSAIQAVPVFIHNHKLAVSSTSALAVSLTTIAIASKITVNADATISVFPHSHSPGSTAANPAESLLAAALFSRPAIITWLSLFFSFLFFAGIVLALQKVMRRIRARRCIREQDGEWEKTARGKSPAVSLGVSPDDGAVGDGVGDGDWVCEFLDGNDVTHTDPPDGVDRRSGSWSRRRDGREWVRRGGKW
ncbi:hypothetical protein Dda_8680 [Drechslerella dactyloides]|uniref:Uncharacterized protein n=1 Tax=Drechslerella dactyloides TaxID=74499 RepID=A0AAD6IUS1_DREDA|nr:hypothetical protein Dda_8680 [Drechslerella dactyloides]